MSPVYSSVLQAYKPGPVTDVEDWDLQDWAEAAKKALDVLTRGALGLHASELLLELARFNGGEAFG